MARDTAFLVFSSHDIKMLLSTIRSLTDDIYLK